MPDGLRVELERCSKRYGERIAVRRVSLRVEPGETLLLLGANGSGKSTLIRMIAGLVRPSAGAALLDGTPAIDAPGPLRARIGYVAHRGLVYRDLTARENLALTARLFRRPAGEVPAVLDRVGLAGREDDRVDGFSRGMTQRLSLARALLAGPDLLLLDEPTTGLDAEGKALFEELVREGRGTRTTILSTHEPDAVRHLADRAVELRGGELVGDGA